MRFVFGLVILAVSSAIAGPLQISTAQLYVHDSSGLVGQLDSSSASYFSTLDGNNEGSFGWMFSNSGPTPLTNLRLLVFLDADIDRDLNTFFNEYGEFIALTLPPAAPISAIAASGWEIDEPGFLFGDIITNLQAGALDNANGVPSSAPDDVSLALLFSIGSLDPGLAATVRLSISPTNINGLRHLDPDSNYEFYFNGYASVDFPQSNNVPEPASLWLVAFAFLAILAVSVAPIRTIRLRCFSGSNRRQSTTKTVLHVSFLLLTFREASLAQTIILPTTETGTSVDFPRPPGTQYPPGPVSGGGLQTPVTVTVPGTQAGLLRVTVQDIGFVGDVYEVFVDGQFVGRTPEVPIDGPTFSAGTFSRRVTPGTHEIQLWNITLSYLNSQSPFGGFVRSNFSPAGVHISATFDGRPDLVPSNLRFTPLGSTATLSVQVSNLGGASTTGTPQSTNLILNDNFELPPALPQPICLQLGGPPNFVQDWQVEGITLACGPLWQLGDGFRSIYLQSQGAAVQQSFSTTPGLTYNVRFLMAGVPSPGQVNTVRVSAGSSQTVFSFDSTGKTGGSMGWLAQSWSFVASSSTTTIRFEHGSNSPLIDAVEVYRGQTEVPVSFYRGNPATTGVLLGTVYTTRPLEPSASEDVSFVWQNPTIGTNNIVAVLDDNGAGQGVVSEADETNNTIGAPFVFGTGATPLVDNLTARFKDSSVDISWSSVPGAIAYNLYRRTTSTASIQIGKGLTRTALTDTGLSNGTTYLYAVRWINAQNVESGEGTEISATPTPTGSAGVTPPSILSFPVTRGAVGSAYSYQVRAADPDAAEVLTYSLVGSPTTMTISSAGRIQWAPQLADAGYKNVQVRVEDRTGRFATQSFKLFIEAVFINNPPLFTSTPIPSALTGQPYLYTARATDADAGDLLAFTLKVSPAGMTINGATGVVQWTPTISQLGAHPVTVEVKDLGGLTAVQSFSVSVTRGNLPPQITSIAPATARVAATYRYQVSATDPDFPAGDTISYALGAIPTGVTISNTGLIQWTPTSQQLGNQSITVRVTDAGGLAATQQFVVNVLPQNQIPFITSIAPTKAAAHGLYSYQATATDPDGDILTWFLGSVAPAGLLVDPSTGLVQWTPSTSQQGVHTATLSVRDTVGQVATQTFTITVGPPDTTTPVVSGLSGLSGTTIQTDTPIFGSVSDANLVNWTISYRVPGDSTWTPFGSGTVNVTNGFLGNFPATLVANNPYRILLSARDVAGNINSQEIEVQVNTGEVKLGDFSVTFEDLRIPGLGLPVGIRRSYDTKQPQTGDFGRGWALSFTGLYLRRDVNYNVYLSLPTGRRVTFNFTPVPIGLGVFNTLYTAQNGVFDTLENTDCPMVVGSGGLYFCNGFLPFEPQNYVLRTKEGLTYFLTATGGIRRIEDRSGNWMEITAAGITTNTAQNIPFIRDVQGRITEIREPSPSTGLLRYEYDSAGRLARFTDQAGAVTRYFYENTSFPNYLTRTEDPLSRPITRNIFDPTGRLVAQCDANGNPTTLAGCVRFNPDVNARTQTIYTARGFRTDLVLDSKGNILNERRYTDATNYLDTVRTYDANNNTLTERDPAGNQKTFTYDSRGNRLTSTDPGGRTSSYTYNACNKVATETDPAGKTTTYTYDAACNLIEVKNALNHTTRYAYNSRGQRTQFTDPNNNTWTWAYDSRGFLTSLTDPFGKAQIFTFGPTGDLLSRVDRLGRRIDFQYDAAHRTIRETWGDGRIINFSYTAAGELLSATDPDSALTMAYHSTGRVKSVDNAGTPAAPRVVISYLYDANGNVTQVADSLGGFTDYSYDGLDRLIRIAQSGIGVQPKRVDMEYNPSSLLRTLRRFSNIAGTAGVANTFYEYDCGACAGRLTAIRHRRASDNSVLHDLTYVRDAVGNISSMTDSDGTHSYGYDAIRQLLTATHSNTALQPNEFYSYDAGGNRLTSHLSNAHIYNRNRLVQDQQFTYQYDEEGNQIQKTNRLTGNYVAYEYDYRNRLRRVAEHNSSGAQTSTKHSTYDAANRRISSGSAPVIRYYAHDQVNPILIFSSDGSIIVRRLYDRLTDGAMSEDLPDVRWLLRDHLGSVRERASNGFSADTHTAYDSFGTMLVPTSKVVSGDLGFTSRERETETLSYFRTRFFDHSSARFLSEDSLPPYSYSYSGNNPVLKNDPSGHLGLLGYAIIGISVVYTIASTVEWIESAVEANDFMEGCMSSAPASYRYSAKGSVTYNYWWSRYRACLNEKNKRWAKAEVDGLTLYSVTSKPFRFLAGVLFDVGLDELTEK